MAKEVKSNGNKRNRNRSSKRPYKKVPNSRGNRQDRRAEEIADTAARMSESNPVRFYTKFEKLAHDAARIPFARPVGTPYSVSGQKHTDPGIMRLVFSPTVGVSTDFNSPMNRSSINYYARLRSTQKAFGDYDHQDLTIMTLAIDSCMMYHALGRRIYGMLTDMTPVNRYYPRCLIIASGVSFTASQKEIQDFRAFLNEFSVQLAAYPVPKGITLLERHQWMCEGLYTDSPATKAQTYMFVPKGFWKYNNTSAVGSSLDWVPYSPVASLESSTLTLDEFMDLGISLLNALYGDADFSTIAGDLYAYYGNDTMSLPYVEEKYKILPSYDETVLSQIENATLMGDWADGYTPKITQNPEVNEGAIIFQPILKKYGTESLSTYVPRMNMHVDTPSEDAVIEATRLMVEASTESSVGYYVQTCASEIVHYADIWVVNPETQAYRFRRLDNFIVLVGNNETIEEIRSDLGDIIYTIAFDWAPRIEVFTVNYTTGNVTYLGCTWDIDNNIDLPVNYLENIHTACLYSLFDAPTK